MDLALIGEHLSFLMTGEGNGNIYVKTTTQSEPLTVTSVGSNHVFKFEESDKDVDSLIVLQ